ncbi:hypothetical protein GCM10009754_37250 [Amycolatopsis minnesotensis]|uniref:Uncharacterized protein n=1 Tax=Amycolatopsis minnesotensis TaxID=337894 RepID=A0ABN2R2P6_9PSEU
MQAPDGAAARAAVVRLGEVERVPERLGQHRFLKWGDEKAAVIGKHPRGEFVATGNRQGAYVHYPTLSGSSQAERTSW